MWDFLHLKKKRNRFIQNNLGRPFRLTISFLSHLKTSKDCIFSMKSFKFEFLKISMTVQNNQLYSKIKAGDSNAFQDMFEKYYTSLFFYACKFVDDELARDLVHDIFIIFWQNKENINIKTSLSAYLFRMVRNKCLQEIEKQKVRDNYNQETILSLKIDELSYYNEGFKSIIELELERKLEEALEKMPDGCRKVFIMSRFDGLKNHEIAEQLNVSVKAIEKQITKAIKIIKVELKEYIPLMAYVYFKISDFM